MCNSMCNNNMDFCWIILILIVIWVFCGNGSIFGCCDRDRDRDHGCGCDC